MSALDLFIAKAKQGGKKLVLPEGQDPRVVAAANMIIEQNVAREVVVLECRLCGCRHNGTKIHCFGLFKISAV